ncbi:MAG: hypothetical protein MZW92_38520 [Comamonadaceae bacterium]|nr:hypothetical protein [Comamonadaceae bacterium]
MAERCEARALRHERECRARPRRPVRPRLRAMGTSRRSADASDAGLYRRSGGQGGRQGALG